ncbi:Crp/Fnr family transcriptional regulator [Thiothrix nivea]|uniref:Crp/Fnr family transcriptional regulator n=1 Tax=Thiothrix nivea TaxID=1031 RepID=UPI0012B6A978|nr:Crp/Fnr family transcriptional regulator [Thiothrix nivea]
MPRPQKEYLLDHSRRLAVSRQERLFENGNQCPGIFCLKAGRIRLGIIAASGNERTIDVVLPGETFGEAGIFKPHEAPVYAQAITQSDLLCIDRNAILDGIQQWPEMGSIFLELACARINQLLAGMYVCCLRNAHQRVNDFLLQNAQPVGRNRTQGVVSLPVSKAVVASSLNLSAETFSRELHVLSDKGLIRVERTSIHVYDLEQLRKQYIN